MMNEMGVSPHKGRYSGHDWSVFFKYMYDNFQDLFDLPSKQTSKINILLGEIRLSSEEKITHVCVCVCVGGGGYM